MRLHLIPLLIIAALGTAADAAPVLIHLENAAVVVEVAPTLGGRIATLRRPQGENVLLYTAPASAPTPSPEGPFLPANGHVVWIGPQSDWWTQQELNPERAKAHATWPPDPYLEYGTMTVSEQTPTSLGLRGPASPVSGIQLSTTIRLEADGAVVQTIAVTNVSTHAVSWDLWPNTRVRPDARFYAPYAAGSRLKVVFGSNNPTAEMPLPPVVADDLLSFDTTIAPGTENQLHLAKAYLPSTEPRLFAVAPHDLLAVVARAPAGAVHPDQSPIEVFQLVGGDPVRALLELEFHSAYVTLPPGGVLRTAVAWQVSPYSGEPTPAAHRRAVKEHEADVVRLRALVTAKPDEH